MTARANLSIGMAECYTSAERRVLEIVIDEIDRRGACARAHSELARLSGFSRSTVRSAIGKAVQLGALKVKARQGEENVIRRVQPSKAATVSKKRFRRKHFQQEYL